MSGLASYIFSGCVLAMFLLLGSFLRAKIRLFHFLFLPSSVIAGFLALLSGPHVFRLMPDWIVNIWAQIPGLLISFVFAALFLGVMIPGAKTIWRRGGPMLCFGVIMGMGQYFIALVVTGLVLVPFFGVPPVFACILEVGFSGGHGTAAGMTELFTRLGFAAGGALGQMSATVGILFAVIMGITLINIAARKGEVTFLDAKKGIPHYKKTGLIPEDKRYSIATATLASESIEPLTFHFAIISLAVLLGWGILAVLQHVSPVMKSFPLFPLAMIGGLVIQKCSIMTGAAKYYDKHTFERIMGFCLDVLVASAIASIRLDLFLDNFLPFTILMISGMTWLTCMVVFVAPRMFPEYWFERSITEFGMQSGVTAVGLLLLRLVDPQYRTGTADAFGLKQIVYEPVLGGGLVTAFSPYFIIKYGVWNGVLVCAMIMGVFFFLSVANGWVRLGKSINNPG